MAAVEIPGVYMRQSWGWFATSIAALAGSQLWEIGRALRKCRRSIAIPVSAFGCSRVTIMLSEVTIFITPSW